MASPLNKEPGAEVTRHGNKRRRNMAEEKMTQKEIFTRIADAMADDPIVVEFCQKNVERLSRPRKKKVNEEMVDLANAVATYMAGADEETFTNKDLVTWINAEGDEENKISSQKMAAVMRYLVGMGTVEKITGEKASDPAMYKIA